MIIETKQTTVAYRCPHCGAGVMSALSIFSVTADMIKLKCDCGNSEMELVMGKDDKIRMTVPCVTCPSPHRFTVSKSLFFGKELFVLPCPYSNLNVAVLGDLNAVKAELARSELELLDLMEKSGVTSLSAEKEEEVLPDPQILDIVMFVINDLDAEGKIYCKCGEENGEERSYDVQITNEGVLVSCRACGASRLIPTDSSLGAHAFLHSDALYLE